MLENQAKAYHPFFHNQLYGGFDEHSFIGAVMGASVNGAVHTYEVAQCFIEMENYLFDYMRKRVGWTDVDGVLTPGGSYANFFAIHLARGRLHPDFHMKGITGCPTMKMLVSESSHYSLRKGANLLGIGMDNVISVNTDDQRRMIPA